MNRSTRQTATSKQAKLDTTVESTFTDIPSTHNSFGQLPPRPLPSANSSENGGSNEDPTVAEFFPELASSSSSSSMKTSSISVDGIILPEPLPPLPDNLNKVYNTRKRTFSSPDSNVLDVASTVTNGSAGGPSSATANASKPAVIPGFVSKLYRMVDESTSNLIKWGHDGLSFVVTSPEEFSRQVLPLFFKHNNFSSFVRQLNMYGFHKVPHLQQGSMAASAIGSTESTIWEFSHVNFIRNRPDILINVRRKIGNSEDGISPTLSSSSTSSLTDSRANSDDFISTARSLRQELSFIYQQQNALRTDLQSLQRDNQLLWNENIASRERHLQQQQVIDRILRFLASVFTTDGKLLASASTGLAGINSSTHSALHTGNVSSQPSSVPQSTSSRQMNRPLLLGNISGNEEELRRHVLELITGGQNSLLDSDKIDLVPDNNSSNMSSNNRFIPNAAFNNRLEDLENTSREMSNDISLADEEISNVLNTKMKNNNNPNTDHDSTSQIYDDLDFSSYLDCQ